MSKNVHFPTLRPKGAQKPSKWHIFPNFGSKYPIKYAHSPNRNPQNYILSPNVSSIYPIKTFIPQVLASYIQYFLIFVKFFANFVHFVNFVLKVVCPQSRLSSKSCHQRRVLNIVRPHCPIVGGRGLTKLKDASYSWVGMNYGYWISDPHLGSPCSSVYQNITQSLRFLCETRSLVLYWYSLIRRIPIKY